MSEYIEYRVYVGPEWSHKTSAYHYDWSQLNDGATTNFYYSTTLTTALTTSATTANVVDTSAFPSKGGCWIAPVAAGEGWEYCKYSGKGATTLTGLVRNTSNREHSGTHGINAVLRFWYPLVTESGNLAWSWKMNDNWNSSYWSGTLSGVLAPKNILRNGHAIVVQKRSSPTGVFANFMLGWISDAEIVDNSRYDAEWSISIASSPLMIQRSEAPPFVIGEINIGASGSVDASSTLASSWKERSSGDYIAAYPSFAANNVTDTDDGSIWISEKYIGTPLGEYVMGGVGVGTTVLDTSLALSGGRLVDDALVITQLHLALPAGQPDGYRWMEFTAMGAQDFANRGLYVGAEDGDTIVLKGTISGYTESIANFSAGDRIIICENADRFNEENPGHGAKQLIDLRDINLPTFLKDRPLSGGAIGLYGGSNASPLKWFHYVAWGTATTATVGVWAATSPVFGNGAGGSVAALTANSGYTLRYNWANSATIKNNWTSDIVHYPGYKIGASGAKEWLIAELPVMGLTLKSAITSGTTGLVTLTTSGGDSTAGLERSGSFTLQIGSEQITASVSSSTQINITARGVNSTTSAAHVAGDPVYFVDSGVATDAFKVRQLRWSHSGGTVHPKQFKLYTSNLESPRTPKETGYTADWSTPISVSAYASATWSSSAIARRPKFTLMEIELMTTNPARARLSTLEAIIDESTFDSATWIASGDAADLIVGILGYVGVPSGAITNPITFSNLKSNSTARGSAWSVITDLADFSSLRIDCSLMSKIDISADNFWLANIFTPLVTWTRANSNQPVLRMAENGTLSQVQLNWKNADNTSSGTAVYPATPDGNGEIITLDDYIFSDGTAAAIAAQKRYLMQKYPWSISVEASTGMTQLSSGYDHKINWAIDPTLPIIDRLIFVTNVEHSIENRVPKTTISGMEIERYSGEQ